MSRELDVAWVAGLFEGEGCIHNKNKNSIAVTISMTDEDVLQKVASKFGGSVATLAQRNEKWKVAHIWTLYGANARDFLAEIMPHLGARRRERAKDAISRYATIEVRAQQKQELRLRILDLWATGMYTEKEVGELTGTNRSYVNAVRLGKMKVDVV